MAWDAADAYLLDYCAEELALSGRRILVADDNFGALSCALSSQVSDAVHHSACATQSARHNLSRNDLGAVNFLDWDELPPDRKYDIVLLRIPKALDLLEDHCHRLRAHMNVGAVLVGAVMDKYLSKGMLEILSARFGPTHTTLGRRKARLTVSEFDPALASEPPPIVRYRVDPFGFSVSNCPGVFSSPQLDIGTRFFLQQFHEVPLASSEHIADLACGNGVLGIAAAMSNPTAKIDFYDDSSIALRSATLSVEENFQDVGRFAFHQGDGLADCPPASLDLVLCNPPFHLGQQQDTSVAGRLFSQARSALKPGGELWVVGNRHLRYPGRLRRRFGNAEVVAANRKFVVVRCRRSGQDGF